MKQITRHEAEDLIHHASIVASQIEQDQEQLSVLIKLADNHVCLITYNLHNQQKNYYEAVAA